MACKQETQNFVKQILAYDCWKTLMDFCVNDCQRRNYSSDKEFNTNYSKQSVASNLSDTSESSHSLTDGTKVDQPNFTCTGRERLIRSHSSARFCFELSGNSN